MKKPQFVNSEIYHIFNRGVEKRSIFLTNGDHLRFISGLVEFNNKLPSPSPNIRFAMRNPANADAHCFEVRLRNNEEPNEPLVEILAFCLMPNHFHLILRQVIDDGIVKFMQKLGTGFTNYFNKKNERVGPLFQGSFKAVLVSQESQLFYLPFYVHLNPLDLIHAGWREGKISDKSKAIRFLESYRWSSFQDYIGKENFPLVTKSKFLTELLGGTAEYKNQTYEWLSNIDLECIEDLLLE